MRKVERVFYRAFMIIIRTILLENTNDKIEQKCLVRQKKVIKIEIKNNTYLFWNYNEHH